MTRSRRAAVVLLCFAVHAVAAQDVALAKDKRADSPSRVAKALKRALSKGEGLGVAFERAEALKGKFTGKQMKPVLKALAGTFGRSNKALKIRALSTFAHLGLAHAYKQFSKLLQIPKKVTGLETRTVHFRAIKTAGLIQAEDALPDLLELLEHTDIAFARGAVWALASFTALEEDARDKLAKRLVDYLQGLERLARGKKAAPAKRATTLIPHMNKTIGAVSGKSGPETAAAWKELLRGA